ncbi:hypothetical protein N0V94_009264 [Neodidymelliopsis sp. IMI 364377]|nr:hypothetical protein N0V94_009264 [Neodidymelliopsis sp. IMI 364377]
MSEPELYWAQYVAAQELLDSDVEASLAAAKENLVQPRLPPYHTMKNLVLIACALGSWDKADVYRLSTEDIYKEELAIAISYRDEASLELLEDVRVQLDKLICYRERDLFGSGSGRDGASDEDEDADGYKEPSDDEEEEEEDDEDYDIHRNPSKSVNSTKVTPTPVKSTRSLEPRTVTASSLRRQKSTINKGGAYNAHQFTKSIGKGGMSRASLYKMWQDEEDKKGKGKSGSH